MNLDLIKRLTILTKPQLYNILLKFLHQKGYSKIWNHDQYLVAEGNIPICLLAHMDTVFANPPDIDEFIYDPEKTILWNPKGSGFDDRAGIYAIIELIQRGYYPHVIFTDLEESGGIGAKKLIEDMPNCPFKKCKALIQVDRANEKDCVFYTCDNKKFTSYIEEYGFEYNYGTFTDISVIAPAWGIAAVNVSCGYLDEHTYTERLVCKWLDNTIDRLEKILANKKMPYFKYKRAERYHFNNTYNLSKCICCDKDINSYKEGHFISDGMGGFMVLCHECYDLFHEGEENPI